MSETKLTSINTSNNKLFLLDAYALIYRSYFAFIKNPRISSTGLNTSAIFGFINTLIDIINRENPSHIGIAFDLHKPTFRHNLYDKYKANREKMPEDLRKSIPYIKEIIDALNISQTSYAGYEADDIVGTLAHKAEKMGFDVYMMTSDKDYIQLISKNVKLYKPKRAGKDIEILNIDDIQAKYGIEDPKQFIDILALWGDNADNIPGAPGIGEKTATKIISKFGNLEGMYQNINTLKPKQQENVIAYEEQIYLSRKLATIITDVPVEFNPSDFELKAFNEVKLTELFAFLEFKNLQNKLIGNIKPTPKNVQYSLFGDSDFEDTVEKSNSELDDIHTTKHEYILIDTKEKRLKLIDELRRNKSFCFDTETTGLNVHLSKLVGISFSINPNKAWYVPIPNNSSALEIVNEFKLIFENPKIEKTGQNLKFDILMLKNYNINVSGNLFDTMIAHYLIEPDMRHNLDLLSEKYLNYKPVPIEELIGKKGKLQKNMRDINIEQIKEYASEDSDITLQLKPILKKKIEEYELNNLFNNIEMPLISVLSNMEKYGVKININSLNEFAEELRKEIIIIETEIFNLAGIEFNISSPKQLGEVLFDRLKIVDNPKKTKTKQYSTGEDVLTKLINKHEIIPKILEYRSLKKLLNTYVEALPKLINPITGRIHTSYNQAVASTGRLSSTDPNLQNIPIREEKGRKIRQAFIPSDENHILISADYSQIELRLMADLSNDENMILAFLNNEDIHKSTAAKIYNCSLNEVTQEQRRNAKTANFGIIYGISAFGLSQRLNIPRKEAKMLIDNYFIQFPGVKTYMDENIKLAREKGYVKTIFGRRRYLRDINSQNGMIRGMAERNAINAPIQGSAADIIKIAMINVYNKINSSGLKSKMIMQVHDELIFDTLKSESKALFEIIKIEMENACKLKVPLLVDIGSGTNWLEAH